MRQILVRVQNQTTKFYFDNNSKMLLKIDEFICKDFLEYPNDWSTELHLLIRSLYGEVEIELITCVLCMKVVIYIL